jgi:hypothetical protein
LNRCKQIEEDQEFEPKISSLCYECPLWHSCPSIKKLGESKLPRAPEDIKGAEEILRIIISKETEADQLKEILKTYVDKNGAISYGDMDANYKPIVTKQYDVRALIEWANGQGKDVLDILSVDGRKAARIEIPKQFIEEKLATRFTIAKRKNS